MSVLAKSYHRKLPTRVVVPDDLDLDDIDIDIYDDGEIQKKIICCHKK